MDEIVNNDPIATAMNQARRAGYETELANGVVTIAAAPGLTRNVALAVLSYFREASFVVIHCRCDELDDERATAVWNRPHLLVVDPAADGTGKGFVYDLERVGLAVLRSGETGSISDREAEFYMPTTSPGSLAGAMLDRASVDRTGLPISQTD